MDQQQKQKQEARPVLTWTQTNQSTVQLADSHHLVFLSLLANIHSSPHTPVFQAAPEHCWSNPLWSMIMSLRGFSLGWPTPPPPPPPPHPHCIGGILNLSWLLSGSASSFANNWPSCEVPAEASESNRCHKPLSLFAQHMLLFLEQHPPPPPHQVLQNTIHLHNNYNLNNFFLLSPSLPSK